PSARVHARPVHVLRAAEPGHRSAAAAHRSADKKELAVAQSVHGEAGTIARAWPALLRRWAFLWSRMTARPLVGIAILVILAIVVCAIGADYIAPANPYATMVARRFQPIGSPGFPLGSDELGRDTLSRLIHGSRLSLAMGLLPVACAFVIGSFLGM